MRHYIIASHKYLARGFYSALQAIVGDVGNVNIISAYVDNESLAQQIENILSKIPESDELIVMTDIYGGSVNNEFVKLLTTRDFHLISGVNLALVIAIMVEIQGEVTREKLIAILDDCKQAMRYCNDDININIKEEDF